MPFSLQAMEASISLARNISRTPAGDLTGFAVKMEALAWELHDDLEEHQLERLQNLANEMRLASSPDEARSLQRRCEC